MAFQTVGGAESDLGRRRTPDALRCAKTTACPFASRLLYRPLIPAYDLGASYRSIADRVSGVWEAGNWKRETGKVRRTRYLATTTRKVTSMHRPKTETYPVATKSRRPAS